MGVSKFVHRDDPGRISLFRATCRIECLGRENTDSTGPSASSRARAQGAVSAEAASFIVPASP